MTLFDKQFHAGGTASQMPCVAIETLHKTSNPSTTYKFGSSSTPSFVCLRHTASAMRGHPRCADETFAPYANSGMWSP